MTKLWLNGQLCTPEEAHLQVSDRGFLLGEAIFETLAVRNGVPIELDAHMRRLAQAAMFLGLPLATTTENMGQIIAALLAANDLSNAAFASLRITLSGGPAPRGLSAPKERHCMLLVSATSASAPAESLSAIVSPICVNEMSPTAHIKHVGYLDKILAKRGSAEAGVDEAILLNSKGRVAEAATANIFIILEDGSVITPSLDEGALPGITRARILQLAQVGKIDIRECAIPSPVLDQAQEIFLTNSLIGVCPLRFLNGRPLNEKGVISLHLRKSYDAFIEGEIKKYSIR